MARAPVYQVKRGGNKAVYLKDDSALEEYRITSGIKDAVFVQHDGVQRAGNDLQDLVERARHTRNLLQPLVRKVGSRTIVEQSAIAGILNPALLDDPARRQQAVRYLAARLDQLAPPAERGRSGEGGARPGVGLTRTRHGATQRRRLDAGLVGHAGARRR